MKIAGLDVGSRATKPVILNEGASILEAHVVASTFDPLSQCAQLIDCTKPDVIPATGYGRHLLREKMGTGVVSEIVAHASGAHWLYPHAKLVLDLGGQDIKCSILGPGGKGPQVRDERSMRCWNREVYRDNDQSLWNGIGRFPLLCYAGIGGCQNL